jgi:predicted transcriptional regulator
VESKVARYAVVGVRSGAEFWDEALTAAEHVDGGAGYQGEHFYFASPAQLFATYTQNRWLLIEKLQQTGPSSLRSLARTMGRDVKRVHEDVAVLLEEGIVERTGDGKLIVPFETISIEAKLRASKAA